MLRVDIPEGDTFSTSYFGSGAIYRLTVISEDVARKLCSRLSQQPSFAWDLREHSKALNYGGAPDDNDENDFG